MCLRVGVSERGANWVVDDERGVNWVMDDA